MNNIDIKTVKMVMELKDSCNSTFRIACMTGLSINTINAIWYSEQNLLRDGKAWVDGHLVKPSLASDMDESYNDNFNDYL